jgi:hypothetical protein
MNREVPLSSTTPQEGRTRIKNWVYDQPIRSGVGYESREEFLTALRAPRQPSQPQVHRPRHEVFPCFWCKVLPGTQRCAGCKRVGYCGPVCQKAHWKSTHKKTCQEKPAAEEEKKEEEKPKPVPEPPNPNVQETMHQTCETLWPTEEQKERRQASKRHH